MSLSEDNHDGLTTQGRAAPRSTLRSASADFQLAQGERPHSPWGGSRLGGGCVLHRASKEILAWGGGRSMKKDITKLPSDVQTQIKALEALPDDQIDTTDAPEILDWSDARRGVFYRPVKRQITLRLDADIIAWFKANALDGRGYQTDINGALREHVQRTAGFVG